MCGWHAIIGRPSCMHRIHHTISVRPVSSLDASVSECTYYCQAIGVLQVVVASAMYAKMVHWIQAFRSMLTCICCHTLVLCSFFFHVYYMLLVHWSDPDTGCFRKRPDWCTCHVLKKHCIGALGDHCSRQSRQGLSCASFLWTGEGVMGSYSR
jgi:hypothetical protein